MSSSEQEVKTALLPCLVGAVPANGLSQSDPRTTSALDAHFTQHHHAATSPLTKPYKSLYTKSPTASTTMLSPHSPHPVSPFFCEDAYTCPQVSAPSHATHPTTIQLSRAAQRLYDYILARYKYDPPSAPGCKVKITEQEWDLVAKKVCEEDPDIFSYFLRKTRWEWDAPKKGEEMGTLRVGASESKLHSHFAASFQGELFAALVRMQVSSSPAPRARDAAAELIVSADSSIHLDGGNIRQPDGSFSYGEELYPPLVIEVLVSQTEKELRKKVNLYFDASDIKTVVAVTIGGPSVDKMKNASYTVFRKLVTAGVWETAEEGPFVFRDIDGGLVDGDKALTLKLNDFLPATEMLSDHENVLVVVPHTKLKKLLDKAVVAEAKFNDQPVAQTNKRKQSPTPSPTEPSSSSEQSQESNEDKSYKDPNPSTRDNKRTKIGTRSTPSSASAV